VSQPRNKLLDTALAFATAGIAVRPAAALIRAPARHDAFGRWICSCGDLLCRMPGEHANAGADWTTDVDHITAIWQAKPQPNLLATSGSRVSFWQVPRVSGAEGMRLFEQQRPGPWPPQLKLSGGDWVVATLPPEGEISLPTGVIHLEPGTPVLVPPSRRLGVKASLWDRSTRLRWQDASRFPRAPLPSAEDVLQLVGRAEQERVELLSGARTFDVA
jgi:hypothetical protein